MSKIIFVEGTIKECNMDRSPELSETYYAKKFIEERGDLDGENNETDNTNT